MRSAHASQLITKIFEEKRHIYKNYFNLPLKQGQWATGDRNIIPAPLHMFWYLAEQGFYRGAAAALIQFGRQTSPSSYFPRMQVTWIRVAKLLLACW